MLRTDQYDVAIRDLQRNKQTAKSDDAKQGWDQVWSDMVTARNHASLVSRFDEESAAARNEAARLSSRPGGARAAEAARVRATELHDIAERHRKAAEEKQEQAEAMMADCVAMSKRDTEAQNSSGQNDEASQQRNRSRRSYEQPAQQEQPQ